MPRKIAVGKQNFSHLIQNNCFYVDKTKFIKDWWDGQDDVTLITRPRRFGKTLMLDTVNTFFSPEFANRSDLFENLEIWKDEQFRNLQGKIPVIFLSFGQFNNTTYEKTISRIKVSLASIYDSFTPYIDLNAISEAGKEIFTSVHPFMPDTTAQDSLHYLCKFLTVQHKIKPIILLDEYDTPLQDAWLNGYWDELVSFMRGFFNATFKTNPYMERAIITGITRVANESIFSDLNNLEVASITTELYDDCFGFTENEVFAAIDEYGLTEKDEVKKWYDGFIFGNKKSIYNPLSIISYLKHKQIKPYWVNTSSNYLVRKLILQSNSVIKEQTKDLLEGKSIQAKLDEQVVFSQLYSKEGAIWSLLMSSGYLKPLKVNFITSEYELTITNQEVRLIFDELISEWFNSPRVNKNKFCEYLLINDLSGMNQTLSDIAEHTFSFYDLAKNQAECFYHAFVLGLTMDLQEQYEILSNRQSGYGRYDVCFVPKRIKNHALIMEFKILDPEQEANLNSTCAYALMQIYEKRYTSDLISRGIPVNNIYVYGIAFQGKKLLIKGGSYSHIDWDDILQTKHSK